VKNRRLMRGSGQVVLKVAAHSRQDLPRLERLG